MFQPDAFFLDKDPPAIVYVSEKETADEEWGFVQFPTLYRLSDQKLLVSFQVAKDSAESYGMDGYRYYLSSDNGKSWNPIKNDERSKHQAYPGVKVDDEVISLDVPIPSKVDELNLPARPYTWLPYNYTYSMPQQAYLFKTLPSFLQTISIRRTNMLGNSVVQNAPIALSNDLRIISGDLFPIIFFGPLKTLPNQEIMGVFYPSFATTSDGLVDTKSGTLLVHSKDAGRSWSQIDRLPYRPDLDYDPKAYLRGGFTEPAAELLSDGTLLLALRTADATAETYPAFLEMGPLYSVTRSREGEWGVPKPINPFGVMPNLLKLKSELIVLSYGRPGVEVRVSNDNGTSWTAPFSILQPERINSRDETCGYSSIVSDPDDPKAFFIAYSNFRHIGADEKLHKAIFVQRCVIKGPFETPQPPKLQPQQVDQTITHYYPGSEKVVSVRIPLFKNQPNGLTQGFYQTGVPSFETPYVAGKLHGLQKFFSPEGFLIKTIPFVEDQRHGVVRTFDKRGNILSEQYMLNDEICTPSEFFKNNQE